jgi:hypothetical protein
LAPKLITWNPAQLRKRARDLLADTGNCLLRRSMSTTNRLRPDAVDDFEV